MGFEIASDLYLAALCAVALGTWIARDLPGSIRERRAGPTRQLLRRFAQIIASAAGGDPVARRLQLPGQSAARVPA